MFPAKFAPFAPHSVDSSGVLFCLFGHKERASTGIVLNFATRSAAGPAEFDRNVGFRGICGAEEAIVLSLFMFL